MSQNRSRPLQHAPLPRGVLLAVLLGTSVAHAFCRTTTCDPKDPTAPDACQYDENGCPVNGAPLHWVPACVAFSVQKDGSPLRGIGFETMNAVVGDAYYDWSQVDCGQGQPPSLRLFLRSPVNCSEVGFNRNLRQPNANLWVFRDQSWPNGASQLALTGVTFNANTGEIYDADVELNSADNAITVGDENLGYDLQSIVEHESGHTLGLAHSPVTDATMFSSYSGGLTFMRSLSADDQAGICVIYPPGEQRGACDPTPRHGFSSECTVPKAKGGCSLARASRTRATGEVALGLSLLAGWGLRRRRTSSLKTRRGAGR